jgi:hypothetical protein
VNRTMSPDVSNGPIYPACAYVCAYAAVENCIVLHAHLYMHDASAAISSPRSQRLDGEPIGLMLMHQKASLRTFNHEKFLS